MKPALSDEIVTMMGIGGPESALRKRIDQLQFDTYTQYDPWVDFGLLDAHPGINGLLGADVLVSGNFVIDLAEMEAYQQKKNITALKKQHNRKRQLRRMRHGFVAYVVDIECERQ